MKFFFAPDVVLTKNFAVVLVGSGDREKPLKTVSSDYFYTVLDRNNGLSMPSGFTPIQFSDLQTETSFTYGVNSLGCYLPMDTAGEKVINGATTVAGITYFGTNEPNPEESSSCTANLGIAKAYALPLLCGTPAKIVLNGGGLMPSPVSGVVQVTYTDASGAKVTAGEPFIIGAGAMNSPISASKVNLPVPPRRTRRYWIDESTP
jgi:type IV pilus assembly protein PilY1